MFLELGLGPGSLYSEIIKENPDVLLHPECEWDAQVRLGDELCLSEQAYLRERKRKMRLAFAEFIGVPLDQVHEDDIPIVAVAGSGGGISPSLLGPFERLDHSLKINYIFYSIFRRLSGNAQHYWLLISL